MRIRNNSDVEDRLGKSDLVDILTSIWERVLQKSPICIHENFFDLGGDSLLAVALFTEIERKTGRELPSIAIYDAPTIASLALLLEQTKSSRFDPLVRLRSGTGEPLFIVHSLGGNVMEFFRLGERLESHRSMYAIQARGLDGTETPLDNIEAMAKYYTDAIKALQPHGPYFLAGYCFGGVVALEIAQRLSSDGEKVALLAFLDSYTHSRSWPLISRIGVWRRMSARRISILLKSPPSATLSYFARRWADIHHNFLSYGVPYGRRRFPVDPTLPVPLQRVNENNEVALARYRPRFYPGKITFIRAEVSLLYPRNPRRVWGDVAQELEIHNVPGEHEEIIDKYVEDLASRLSYCLRRAGDRQ